MLVHWSVGEATERCIGRHIDSTPLFDGNSIKHRFAELMRMGA